jgi:hypothetical protein
VRLFSVFILDFGKLEIEFCAYRCRLSAVMVTSSLTLTGVTFGLRNILLLC